MFNLRQYLLSGDMKHCFLIGCVILAFVSFEAFDFASERVVLRTLERSLLRKFKDIESEIKANRVSVSIDYEDETKITLLRPRRRLSLMRFVHGIDALCWYVTLDEEGLIREVSCYDYPKFSQQLFCVSDLGRREKLRFDRDGLFNISIKSRSYRGWPIYKVMLDLRYRGGVALRRHGLEPFNITFVPDDDNKFRRKVDIDVPRTTIVDAFTYVADSCGCKVSVTEEGEVIVKLCEVEEK